MLETYLFVPANRLEFIEKAKSYKPDNIIYDFEESVPFSEKDSAIRNFPISYINADAFARPYFVADENGELKLDWLISLIELGFQNFILPKISTIEELERIYVAGSNLIDKLSFILLVENPLCLISLTQIVKSSPINLIGLGLGSHDYANEMGMDHSLENLYFARHQILNVARAFSLKAVDIVSMDLKAESSFVEECKNSFTSGFDAKFVLHPKQVEQLQSIHFYSQKEIDEAVAVYNKIRGLNLNNFSVINVDGKLYEKPHLKRIFKIIDWKQNYGN